MVSSLRIKSAEEFEKLLRFLADEIFQAKAHYTILDEIRRLGGKYKDEINFSQFFWWYTFHAHADACVLRVLRVYDQHSSGFHLLRLLKTVKDNHQLFQQSPDKIVLESDIHFVSEANPRIKLIKKWRDEVMFHKQPNHLLSGRSFESDNPLPLTEILELIEAAAKVVNRYSSYFNSVYYETNSEQLSNIDFVFEALTHHPDIVEFKKHEKKRAIPAEGD
jgi:hypothetical protein